MRFHPHLYAAALGYYNKSPNYPRTFSLATFIGKDGTPVTTLCHCHAPSASRQGRAVWVQVNETADNFPIRKPGNGDITTVRTVTLDWEYPPDPPRAHTLARDLVQALADLGLAYADHPIEDSGAGPHIALPIPAISATEHGGGVLINSAVERVVQTHVLPLFTELAERHALTGL